MFKFVLALCCIIWGTFEVSGQTSTATMKIDWMTIEEAEQANKKEPRKIFVDVYTNWCGWCKKMDKTTFSDSLVQKYGKEKFYFVKLNAEDQNSIIFKEKVFRYNAQMQANELAVQLLNGQMGYPTLVFLDEKSTPIQTFGSYMDAKQFLMLLHYFGDNAYRKKKSLDEFAKEFKP
jgi:thioredoxin-related protein